jgi:hypothetical protein
VRHGRLKLDDEIKAIFGESEKTDDGNEKFIEYKEYIEKVNNRAMEERRAKKEEKKKRDWSKKEPTHDQDEG